MNNEQARKFYLGKTFQTNSCGELIVTKYLKSCYVTAQFKNTGTVVITDMDNIKRGAVYDAFAKTVCGIGYLGNQVSSVNGQVLPEYTLWHNMMKRCYDAHVKELSPSYKSCKASVKFHNFSYFYKWCHKQVGFGLAGFHLDKDILKKGNKVYSEKTCCFVPSEINALLVNSKATRGEHPLGVSFSKLHNCFEAYLTKFNVKHSLGLFSTEYEAFLSYKAAKESHLKAVATKWKEHIDLRVYEALMSWEVTITD